MLPSRLFIGAGIEVLSHLSHMTSLSGPSLVFTTIRVEPNSSHLEPPMCSDSRKEASSAS